MTVAFDKTLRMFKPGFEILFEVFYRFD